MCGIAGLFEKDSTCEPDPGPTHPTPIRGIRTRKEASHDRRAPLERGRVREHCHGIEAGRRFARLQESSKCLARSPRLVEFDGPS